MILLCLKLFALLFGTALVVAMVTRALGENLHLLLGMLTSVALSLASAAVITLGLHHSGVDTWNVLGGMVLTWLGYGVVAIVYRGEAFQVLSVLSALVGYGVFTFWQRGATGAFGWLYRWLGGA